jgi:hypothetical protein
MEDLEEEEEEVPEVVSVATMSKQQSEDHSIAESRGSGTRYAPAHQESEDNSADHQPSEEQGSFYEAPFRPKRFRTKFSPFTYGHLKKYLTKTDATPGFQLVLLN